MGLFEPYTTLNIRTELWQKHEGYVRYYYWVSYLDGKPSTASKYRKELYEGEITLFREKIDRRRKFILDKELEGFTEVIGNKKKQFEIDVFSPKNHILHKDSKNINNLYIFKSK